MEKRKWMLYTVVICGLLLTSACSNDKGKDDAEAPPAALESGVNSQETGTKPQDQADGDDGAGDKQEVPVDQQEVQQDVKKASDEPAAIGEALDYHGMIVKVNGIRDSNGDDYLKPEAGNTLKVLDITVENRSDAQQVVSSANSFDLTDENDKSYMEAITADIKQSLDGTLAPGEKLQGEIAYEVGKDVKGLKLSYGDPLKEGRAYWALN